MSNPKKFIAAFLVLLLVLGIVLKMKLFFGWAPDLVLALGVVFGLIFGLKETLFLSAFSAWVMNWRPVPGAELAVLLAIALISYFGRYFMPWQRWLSLLLLTVTGTILLYLAASPALAAANWPAILADGALSAVFGFFVFRFFRKVFGK